MILEHFLFISFFIFNVSATPEIYTLSLHDALPISLAGGRIVASRDSLVGVVTRRHREREDRSEEHTSELQSLTKLVCRLLLEKKKMISSLTQSKTSIPQMMSAAKRTVIMKRTQTSA